MVSYDSRYGWLNVDDIKPTSDGFISALKTKVGKGFTQIVPYEEGPRRYLLMYKGSTGFMALPQLKLSAFLKSSAMSLLSLPKFKCQ